ncbi:MAG TPA: glycine betaine ABC transporter substrate-binding protein [Hyphomicrobiales bacterium]|nr:glycine betaine ABC transporter substrate-binding protein [Hyphomicrobiales bacterium]
MQGLPARRCLGSVLGAILILAAASPAHAGKASIAIGSKKFTESYVLAEIAKIALQRAGFAVLHREGMGGTVILWQALLQGAISSYPEYTGTISEEILKAPVATNEDAMRAALEQRGIGMTASLGFSDSYTLVMRRSQAKALGIRSISDLKRHPELRAGPTPEFLGRQDGWAPLVQRYGLSFSSVNAVEHGLGYAALANGKIDVKDCYTTDAKIAALDLVALSDDLNFFPQYKAVFLYRLDAPATAVAVLKSLEGKISEGKMIALNREAEEKKSYAAAASSFFQPAEAATTSSRMQRWIALLAPIPRLALQHITLVVASLAAAILVSIPLGIVASKPGLASEAILGSMGIIQTIPSLALLAFMIPLFGIGQAPAIAALFLYSLLPIVRGTATGLAGVPFSMQEAAEALGLNRFTWLWRVALPMASPSILSGIKTSAVINVGTATLAGLIGGGGFGEPIQSGLQLNDTATILQGAIPAAVLALLVQAAFAGVDRLATPKGLRLKPGSRLRNR